MLEGLEGAETVEVGMLFGTPESDTASCWKQTLEGIFS